MGNAKGSVHEASSSWTEPTYYEMIPHSHASGADGPDVSIYYRVPSAATKEMPVPTMLLITGLDGHRPTILNGWTNS